MRTRNAGENWTTVLAVDAHRAWLTGVRQCLSIAEDEAIEADRRKGAIARDKRNDLLAAGPDEPGWARLSQRILRSTLVEHYPDFGEDDLRLASRVLLAYWGSAWNCYEHGAAAAYLDVARIIERFELPPFAAFRRSSAQMASRILGRQTTLGPHARLPSVALHRNALTQRLRYEHARRAVLGEHSSRPPSTPSLRSGLSLSMPDAPRPGVTTQREFQDTLQVMTRPLPTLPHGTTNELAAPRADGRARGIGAAIAVAKRRLPSHARDCATDEAIRKTFEECRHLRAAADSQQEQGVPVYRRDWPGRFYLPSQETCGKLGWRQLSEDLSSCGVESDDPLRWLGTLFRV